MTIEKVKEVLKKHIGDTVTITISPNANCRTESVTVTGPTGNVIQTTKVI